MTTKRVERARESAVLAGVLAGLAKYFDQDPVLFRIIAIAVLIVTGIFPGAFFYLLAWLFIPQEPPTKADYTVVG